MRFAPSLIAFALLSLPAHAQDDPPGEAAEAVELPAPAVVGLSLSDALAGMVTDPLFLNAQVSVQVVRANDGTVVWSHGDDVALVPASTMKLLTAAVALDTLGSTWRFPTWVMVDGEVDADGVLDGDLYIKGQGDPAMVVERLWRVAMDIRLQGIREVKGNVYFDDAYFGDGTLIPGWIEEDDLNEGPTYFPPLGALSVNYNIAAFVIRPTSAGQAAVVEFEAPNATIAIESSVTTGSTRSRYWYEIDREVDPDTNVATFAIKGNIPSDSPVKTVYRALSDPLGNYIGVFQSVMKQHGIKVKGGYKPGLTSDDATLLFASYSDPLVEVLAQMNKRSNNFMAEQILRCVGAEKYGLPGTTEKGIQAVSAYLARIGVPGDAVSLVNGSGLSRDMRVRPSAMNAVLVSMFRDPEMGPEFITTLSVGGRDGTLAYRFRDDGLEGRVRGKTGTLDEVATLAGYVRARDEEVYAFTFLANGIAGATTRARRAQERLVLTLAGTTGNVADGGDPGAQATP